MEDRKILIFGFFAGFIKRAAMDHIVTFIKDWGYWAIFLGSLVEGESVILTASSLAALGYFNIKKVMLIAFFGTLLADQMLYYLGYFKGEVIFKRFPSLRQPADKAFSMLHKYDTWFILSCRFIYGIRIISSIVIGAARVQPWRFMILNMIAAAIWAVVSCMAGYLLGDIVCEWLAHFESWQKFFIIGGVAVAVFTLLTIRRRRKKKKALEEKKDVAMVQEGCEDPKKPDHS